MLAIPGIRVGIDIRNRTGCIRLHGNNGAVVKRDCFRDPLKQRSGKDFLHCWSPISITIVLDPRHRPISRSPARSPICPAILAEEIRIIWAPMECEDAELARSHRCPKHVVERPMPSAVPLEATTPAVGPVVFIDHMSVDKVLIVVIASDDCLGVLNKCLP